MYLALLAYISIRTVIPLSFLLSLSVHSFLCLLILSLTLSFLLFPSQVENLDHRSRLLHDIEKADGTSDVIREMNRNARVRERVLSFLSSFLFLSVCFCLSFSLFLYLSVSLFSAFLYVLPLLSFSLLFSVFSVLSVLSSASLLSLPSSL